MRTIEAMAFYRRERLERRSPVRVVRTLRRTVVTDEPDRRELYEEIFPCVGEP